MIIFVNSVQKESVQGRHNQVIYSGTGKQMSKIAKKQHRAEGVADKLSFGLDPKKGMYKTGLDKTIDNPFKGTKFNVGSEWITKFKEISKLDEITLQTYYEILDNVPEGHYTSLPKSPVIYDWVRKPNSPITVEGSYIEEFKVILYPEKSNRFDDSTPRGRMAIQLLKNHRLVAPSKERMIPSVHLYYIADENEGEQERVARNSLINKAVYNLVKLENECTPDKLYQVAVLCTDKDNKSLVTGRDVSPVRVIDQLNRYIKENTPEQSKNLSKFTKIVDLLFSKDAVNAKRFHVNYVVQQAINNRIIGVVDGFYTWFKQKDQPTVYRAFNSKDALNNFFLLEYERYDETESILNWYGELKAELTAKNIQVD